MITLPVDNDLNNGDWVKLSDEYLAHLGWTSVEAVRTWMAENGMSRQDLHRLPMYKHHVKKHTWLADV